MGRFFSIAGHKDAVKAIRATLLTNHWLNVGIHEICPSQDEIRNKCKALSSGIVHTAIFVKNDLGHRNYYALTEQDPGF